LTAKVNKVIIYTQKSRSQMIELIWQFITRSEWSLSQIINTTW